jgi:putative phosphoribosyl transferase
MACHELEIDIPTDHDRMMGTLVIPDQPQGLVLFAHGSGSSRFSPRNRFVAGSLHRAGFGTLLLDLLTPDEERADATAGFLRFDIDLLAKRVITATDWLAEEKTIPSSHLGYFGASTGAAAALIAAAKRPSIVGAVVSRGGRPDLAGAVLADVRAPTLLIVGGDDDGVVELNQEAWRALGAPHKDLQIVPGATHLFEEPGALEEVARLAAEWFERTLAPTHEAARHAGA